MLAPTGLLHLLMSNERFGVDSMIKLFLGHYKYTLCTAG